jgi:hypothetical protein
MDESGYGVAELQITICQGVAADEGDPGFVKLLSAPAHDLCEYFQVLGTIGRTGDCHGGQRRAAHCVHIAERVGGRDSTEAERIIDNRGEEVERLNERAVCVDPEDTGIIRGRKADEHIGMSPFWYLIQDLDQAGGAQLAGSAGARCHFR